jgi:drug/metabolite transporter (DMT)-like permease
MKASHRSGSGIVLALAGAFCYGFIITFAKIAAGLGVSGATIVAERVLVMIGIGLFVTLANRSVFVVAEREIAPLLILGVSSIGVSICYLSSVAFIPITIAAVIFYTFPIVIVLISPFVDRKPLTLSILCIVVIAFVGVVLVLGTAPGHLDSRGVLLAAAASLSAAVQFFAATRCRQTTTTAKLVISQAIVLPAALLTVYFTGAPLTLDAHRAALVPIGLTIGGYVIGLGCQILALARISASVAGLVFCLEPVVAAITSAVVLGERLATNQYLGGCLVIAAIVANVVAEN